ncbi:MAG: type II toxin-antitoxin system HicA family toxin [Deltaproteobacteria bacterium]|nr:type II toxin-antitoxin system HicA family toxin [Deltaproteobacteria bacterium]
MSKLSPVSFSELVRKLKTLDFEGPFSGGKHLFMIKGDLRLTISNPHRQDIGVELLKKILRQGGIRRDEWNQA